MGICHGCSGYGCNAPQGCPATVCVVDDATSWTIPRNKYRLVNDDHEEELKVEVHGDDTSAPPGQNDDAKLELVFEEDTYQRLVARDDYVASPQQGMQLNQLRIKQPSQGPRGHFRLPGCAKGSAPECGLPTVCRKFPHP